MTNHIAEYAQFIADHIDVTLVLKYGAGLSDQEAAKRADIVLRDEGWHGRKYPIGFFTIATVPAEAYVEAGLTPPE